MEIRQTTARELLALIKEHADRADRLAQISCTRVQGQAAQGVPAGEAEVSFELTYSFAQKSALTHVRLVMADGATTVPSITDFYPCAFLYENEIHDLFGIAFSGLKPDYQGKLYKTRKSFPLRMGKPGGQTKE